MMAGLLDHVWQSTLFAAAAGLLTLAMRRNGARIRFWLWFAASMKFLLPFSVLAGLGGIIAKLHPVTIATPHFIALRPAAEPFVMPTSAMPAGADHGIAFWFTLVWALGLAVILAIHLVRWMRLYRVARHAQDTALPAPVRIKTSASLLEPGLVGILNPAVLLPSGLMARLSIAEMNAILAHELAHFRSRDNLTAAFHMVVEALFWFWPPVWFIGARLIAERERACDESVLASGHDAEIYAGGILKVCKFCVRSPLACASGASGADLRQRVERIMIGEATAALSPARKTVLAGVAGAAIVLPVLAGFLSSPLVAEVQRRAAVAQARIGEAAVRMVAAPLAAVLVPRTHERNAAARPSKAVVHVTMPPVPGLAPAVAPLPAVPGSAAQVQPQPVSQPVLAPAKPSPDQSAADALRQAAVVLAPIGAGDPNAITCRLPQVLPGSRLPGPTVCKFNRVWAWMRANNVELSPDGTYLFATMGRNRDLQVLASRCYTGNSQPSLPSGIALDAATISPCR